MMLLARLLASFQSLPPLPTSKLCHSSADSWVGGFVYILGPCGSLQHTLLWGWEFLDSPAAATSTGYFSQRFWGFISLCWNPGLFLLVYPQANVGLPALPVDTLPAQVLQPLPCCVFSPLWLPVSTPPTSLYECLFFNSLVGRLTYGSIFWLFWLFFVFKFVVVGRGYWGEGCIGATIKDTRTKSRGSEVALTGVGWRDVEKMQTIVTE